MDVVTSDTEPHPYSATSQTNQMMQQAHAANDDILTLSSSTNQQQPSPTLHLPQQHLQQHSDFEVHPHLSHVNSTLTEHKKQEENFRELQEPGTFVVR